MKVNLPESFEEKMKELLQDEYEEYAACFEDENLSGIRVNTLKLSPDEFKEISPFEIERIPWIKNGFFYEEEAQPARHPYYYGGLYYLQEPSAMTPASLLDVQPGDRVLDVCAAPGGKSTELAAKLKGEGVLVSNDISNSRAKGLLKNIELFGVRNAIVTSEAPDKLLQTFDGYFDKILVDAPCSGEGMFRKMPSMIKTWEEYGVDYYAALQREIITTAAKMLRPGGYLLYSTCTFSPEENEGTIQYLLNENPDMEVVPAIDEKNPNQDVSYEGFSFGRPDWIPDGCEELKHCIRIWPHKIAGEGHFVALLHKKETAEEGRVRIEERKAPGKNAISEEAMKFMDSLKFEIDPKQLMVLEDRIYLLPKGIPSLKGLRMLRSGLLIGEMKKNRFEPSQALANALKMEEYDNCYDLAADDIDVIRYLKCESIEIKKEVKDGWVLVCVNGHPLGFGKYSKGNFKNKYLPGWRWM